MGDHPNQQGQRGQFKKPDKLSLNGFPSSYKYLYSKPQQQIVFFSSCFSLMKGWL